MVRNDTERIKKIELEHRQWEILLQTLVLGFITVALFVVGYFSGQGKLSDIWLPIGFILAVISILILVFYIHLSKIRLKLKGQAQFGIVIVIVAIAILFIAMSYGGFENLIKEFVTYTPYFKSITITSTTAYTGDRILFYYEIRNPRNSTFIPQISFNYDVNCFSSDIEPSEKRQIKPISSKTESLQYTEFYVRDWEKCYGSIQKIDIILFDEVSNQLDIKSTEIRIIRRV